MKSSVEKAALTPANVRAILLRALLAVVLFALPAAAFAQASESEAIKAVIKGETDTYFKRDTEGWQSKWVQDAKTTRTLVVNNSYVSVVGWDKMKEDMLKDMKDNPKPIPYEVASDNFLISTNGNMAWVEFEQTLNIPSFQVTSKSHEQRMLLKQDNQWKLLTQTTIDKDLFGSDPKAIEASMNSVGYKLMTANKLKEAIEVLKLNATLYPQSWNVFDSLAQAYAKAGNKALAVQNYEKSLQLNPTSEGGKMALAKLKQK